MMTVEQNFSLITGFNSLALGLSIPAWLASPGLIALLSNGSAVLASLNALRPIMQQRARECHQAAPTPPADAMRCHASAA